MTFAKRITRLIQRALGRADSGRRRRGDLGSNLAAQAFRRW
ncbi:hypothetical protein [Rhodoferax sp.]|nr:hypothetical protein [Rhodoferax sp.]